jgi:hypothetical protein
MPPPLPLLIVPTCGCACGSEPGEPDEHARHLSDGAVTVMSLGASLFFVGYSISFIHWTQEGAKSVGGTELVPIVGPIIAAAREDQSWHRSDLWAGPLAFAIWSQATGAVLMAASAFVDRDHRQPVHIGASASAHEGAITLSGRF